MKRPFTGVLWTFFIACSMSALAYLHNDIFIDFADEGFLWYGADHVLKGLLPIRDFQAYDPGRYFWCAAVFAWTGPGLMALRLAAGLFQWLGLFLGLLALRRAVGGSWQLFGAGFIAISWMLIPCRYFDASLPLITVFFAARLAEKVSKKRLMVSGVVTGFVSFIGINHGLYALAGFLSLVVFLEHGKGRAVLLKSLSVFLVGVVLGLAPYWVLFLTSPGFWTSYIERFLGLLSARISGKADVSLPVPWPWIVRWDPKGDLPTFQAKFLDYTNRSSIGWMFLFVAAYYVAASFKIIRMKMAADKPQALFIASYFIGLFYLGHIYTRSDVNYMGEGIFPVMAGLIALYAASRPGLSRRILASAFVFFAVGSLAAASLVNTIAFKTFVPKSAMVWYSVGRDRIWLLRSDAEYVDGVKKLVSKYVGPDEPILLAPLLTTFYCILEKDSPVYELYFHLAPLPAQEQRDIERLEKKKLRWAIIGNLLIDKHPEQSFSVSHPLLWGYLMTHFEAVTAEGLRPGHILMKRKS